MRDFPTTSVAMVGVIMRSPPPHRPNDGGLGCCWEYFLCFFRKSQETCSPPTPGLYPGHEQQVYVNQSLAPRRACLFPQGFPVSPLSPRPCRRFPTWPPSGSHCGKFSKKSFVSIKKSFFPPRQVPLTVRHTMNEFTIERVPTEHPTLGLVFFGGREGPS